MDEPLSAPGIGESSEALIAIGDQPPSAVASELPKPLASSKKFNREHFESILTNKNILLTDVSRALILRDADDPKLRALGAEFYPVLLKALTEMYQGESGGWECYIGDHIPCGVYYIPGRYMIVDYAREAADLAPPNWERQIQDSRVTFNEAVVVLKGASRDLLTNQLYRLIQELLASIDSLARTPDDKLAFARTKEAITYAQEKNVEIGRSIRDLALQTERRIAQQSYLFGMVPGLALVAIVVYFARHVVIPGVDVNSVSVSLAAGALGALLSVLARTTSAQFSKSLEVHYQVGTKLIFCVGAFRPLVGALLGFAVYMVINSGLLPLKIPQGTQAGSYFATIALLAGFSERLAQDALVQTGRRMFRLGGQEPSK